MEAKTKRRRTRRMLKAFQQLLPKEKLDTQRKVILLVSIVIRYLIHYINVGEDLMLNIVNAIN